MRYSIGEHTLETHKWETYIQMCDYLDRCDGGSILLCEEPTYEAEFYSVTAYLNYFIKDKISFLESQELQFGIGLCNEVVGITPHLLWLPPNHIVVGFDHKIAGLRIDKREIGFQVTFDTPFRSFLLLEDSEILLVFNEIGVVALQENGLEVWRYEKDVISEYTVEKNVITLLFLDSPLVKIDLLSGQLLTRETLIS